MRVLVCGGRDYEDRETVFAELDKLHAIHGDMIIIVGGANGADRLGKGWAINNGAQIFTFRANWQKFGDAAGPIRNQQMLDEGKPDLVLAFPSVKRGLVDRTGRVTGTGDMVQRARDAGVEVRVIGLEKKGLFE